MDVGLNSATPFSSYVPLGRTYVLSEPLPPNLEHLLRA